MINNLEDNPMVLSLIFFTLIPLLILTIGLGSNMLAGTDYQTAVGVIDTKEFNVDDNWSEKGTLNNLNTDSEIIYPSKNEEGNFTSDIQDIPEARLIEYEYEADMRDGNGNFTVNAWKDNLTTGSPDKTVTKSLESGIVTNEINLTEYDYFEFVFNINETSGSSNQRPNVDYFYAEFDIVSTKQIGLDKGTTQIFYYLIMFLGVFSISFISFKGIKESLIRWSEITRLKNKIKILNALTFLILSLFFLNTLNISLYGSDSKVLNYSKDVKFDHCFNNNYNERICFNTYKITRSFDTGIPLIIKVKNPYEKNGFIYYINEAFRYEN